MGVKFNLSTQEIKSDTIDIFERMKRDSEYKQSLYDNYAFELHKKKK